MISELSVLIPVYNFDITLLVTNLLEQFRQQNCRFEICLTDDASEEKFRLKHRSLNDHPEVRYVELRKNIGRSAIRNLLAHEANFKWFLFLDNDNALPDNSFAERYLKNQEFSDVVIGGTIYEKMLPSAEYALRWKYGRKREEKPASERSKNPYQGFTLNNMLIRREVYLANKLDTGLKFGYGHEDTKFGLGLKSVGIPVTHLDNPVIHLGLEAADIFLKKTEQAVANLYQLFKTNDGMLENKLVRSFLFLQKAGAGKTFFRLLKKLKPGMLQNLNSADPSLFYFDLYKLYLFLSLAEPDNKN